MATYWNLGDVDDDDGGNDAGDNSDDKSEQTVENFNWILH